MIFDINNKEPITKMYYKDRFDLWRNRLTEEEFQAITVELESMIDGNVVHTSSWMPGNNWKRTVFEPIYSKSCNEDETLSGMCFGLFVWYVFQNREDEWYVINSEDVKGKVYFRKQY